MAVTAYEHLNQAGVLQLATDIFTKVNTRIAERIIAGPVTTDDYSVSNKALSAQAVLALIGAATDAASAEGTLYARIAAVKATADAAATATDLTELEEAVGESTDTADATGSLFARVAATKSVADGAATAIGTASDTADATGTLYARVAATKAVADGAATDIGASTDTADATGSLYARVAATKSVADGAATAIGAATDTASAEGTLYARIAAVKATADAAATTTDLSTLEGRVDTAEGDIDDLETAVGASTDAADATGSLYARVAATKAVADGAATAIGTSSDVADATGTLYARIAATKAVADAAATTTDLSTLEGRVDTAEGDIDDLETAVGASTDAADIAGSVFARIAALSGQISALNNLSYEVVTGPISSVTAPKTDVLYLQHDEPSLAVNNAGYLIDSNGQPATVSGYYGWVDASTGTIYRAENTTTHTSTVLQANDPLLAESGPVARVEDTTYNLYVATSVSGSTATWVCVGDTELTLANYWNKTDASVSELQALILTPISNADISAQVTAAFNATTPA